MKSNKPYFTFSFKGSIILLLLSVSLNHAYGQSDPCDTGSENSCQCETADLLCNIGELDGYQYSMTTYLHPEDGPDPMCTGSEGNNTTSHNPTWFAFIAWCEELTLEVEYTDCINNPNSCFSFGIQAAVYSDCSLDPSSAVECDTDVGGCVNNSTREVSMSGLIIGDTYYFLVDGCCGSACEIEISVIGECGFGDIAPWGQEMQGPEEICLPADEEEYTIEKLEGAAEYYWYVDDVPFPYPDEFDPRYIFVTWTTPGIHTICVDVSKEPCIFEEDFPPPLCKTICVIPSDAEAGTVSATPSPECPESDISIEATGYNDIAELTEYIFVTNSGGEIIFTESGDNATFTADECGTYTAYSYNFKDNETFNAPEIGQFIPDIADCDTTCFCEMEPLEFIIEDNEDPIFTAPPADLDIDCFDGLAAMENLDWTDNCAGSGNVEGTELGSVDLCLGGSYTRTWTYTDLCDNETTHIQNIVVSAIPEAVFDIEPANETVECLTDIIPSVDLNYTNSSVSTCLIEGTLSAVESATPTQCGGTMTYTWSYTDLCGRDLEYIQTITVESTDPPVYVDPPADITYDCIDEVTTAVDLVWNSNCGGTGTTTAVEVDDTDACLGGTITRTWDYIDPCGQAVNHTQIITINPVPPVEWTSVLPADIDVVCGEAFPPFEDMTFSNGAVAECLDEGMVSPIENGGHLVCGDVVTRTWSYTPTCGDIITHIQNITLIDTETPIFTNPPSDVTFTCISEVSTAPDLTWTDNCDGTGTVSAVETDDTDACLGGTITRTWEYTDACDNPLTYTQIITIDPIPDVTWTSMLPADITITCDDAIPTFNMLDYSNGAQEVICLDEGSVSGTEVGVLNICGDIITRTWTYTPTCGPSISHTQNIELEDTETPTWPTAPGDIAYDCISEVPAMTDQSWEDNCDGTGMVSGVEDDMTSGCAGGAITRTWSYTDQCGNPSMYVQTITVNAIPVVDWTSTLPGNEDITCNDPIPTLLELEYSNNSGIIGCLDEGMVSATEVGTLVECGDQIVRNWEYLTICGDVITHMQTITLVDTDPPVFIAPPMDETFDCILDVPIATDLIWTDICDGTDLVPVTEDDMTDDCTGGSITRTWEYTDACGNPATHTQIITVNPVPDVVWTSTLPTDQIIQCGDPIPTLVDLDYSNSSPSTNCLDEGTISASEMGALIICGDMITRTWEYTPTCGPVLTHVQTITLEDMIAPVFVDPPGDETYDCLLDVTPEVVLTWTDNCDGTGMVSPNIVDVTDACTGGTITRDWEYIDACGNPVTHTQIITVNPVPDVVWVTSLPADVTLQCSDAIPGSIDLDYSNSSPSTSCLDEGTIAPAEDGALVICGDMITRTWEYTPTCGMVLTHVQTITLEDMIPPVFVDPPSDEIYDCVADVTASTDLIWTDNCDGTGVVSPTLDGTLDDCTGGTATRTWLYTDACGNPVTHVQTVIVNPLPDVVFTTAPPADVILQCGDAIPDAIDLNYSNSAASPTCLDEGVIPPLEAGALVVCGDEITRTWEYTPACGPPLSYTQTITLEDLIPPVFVGAPADETYDCLADVTPEMDITWTDNCDGTGMVSPSISDTSDPCTGGNITRTWEYTDQCGNPVTHVQSLTINPVPDVMWTTALPANVILQCGDAIPDAINLNYSNGLSGVICAENGTISPVEDGSIMFCGDMITRTWEYTPACGPPLSYIQTITLEDTESPVLINPLGNATYNCFADVPAAEDLTWTDNCDGTGTVSVTEVGTVDNCAGGILSRTWEYTDACGNTTPHVQTITVEPIPDVIWTSSLPTDADVNCGDAIPNVVDLNYSNNSLSMTCLDQGVITPIEDGTLITCGDQIIRTWSYTPECGPPLEHTQTITLVDTEAPVFIGAPGDESYDCYGDVTAAIDLTWTDNCDGTGVVSPTITDDYDNCNGGTITRVWSYTDECGNPINHTQTINIGMIPNINWITALPTNVTINCGDPVPVAITLEYSNNAIGDLCLDEGFLAPTESGTLVSCGDQIIREWEVTPTCGPPITHQQIITLDDILDPVFINLPMSTLNLSCIDDLPANGDITWTDNCDGTGTVSFLEIGVLDECTGGTVTRIWDYTDSCGNGPVSFTQIINLSKPEEQPCNDGDDCTINDTEIVSCNGVICEPCAGTPTDCSGDTEAVVCDDNNDCTVNDIQIIACNGQICVPCQGTPATCDDGIVFVQSCNDLDPCTINDEVTVDCQGDVCIPCAGTPNPTSDPEVPTIPNTCFGETATITVSVCDGGINTWYSDPAGSTVVFIGSTFETTPLTIDATYYVDCTIDGCQSELVEVFLPVVTPEIVTIVGDDFICENETTTLTTNLPFDFYEWNTGDITQTITVDNEGVYEVTVTDSNGCTSTDEFILTVAFNPFVQIAGSTTYCEGSSTLLSAPFGFSEYEWSPNFENTFSINVNSEGTYTVTVTDLNGCTGSSSVEVIEAEVLNPNISGGDNFCAGGFVELSIGSGFSNIEWLPGGENTESIIVDEAGVYSVTVQDGTCEGIAIITVTENPLPTPIINAPSGICPNELASLNANNPDYTNYIWSTGSVNSSILTGMPGTYSVTVTDMNDCTASSSVTMDFIAPPIAEIIGDNQICPDPGSSIILSANTGTNLTYEWSTGDITNMITVTEAGTYSLTVSDDSNCSAIATTIISNHQSPDVIISGSQSFCTDGITTIDAGDFASYVWAPNGEMTRTIDVDTEGTYSVTITDENGCTGTSATMIQELTELLPVIAGPNLVCPGETSTLFIGGDFESYSWSTGEMGINTITVDPGMSYSVTVTDLSGCTGSSMIMVSNYNVTQVTIDGESDFCEGELSELTALGGFEEYEWSNGSSGQTITINESQSYSVTATDSNGCTSETSINVEQIDNPIPTIMGITEVCADSQTTLSTETYSSYEWSNGSLEQTTIVDIGGAISVTVTDANGCVGNTSIIVTEFNVPNVAITGSPSFCLGGFTTLGTLDEYQVYSWSPGGENTPTINADAEGTYTVTVTDINGCTASTSINTSLETSLSPTINGPSLICSGQTETLTVGAFDTYEWSTGSIDQFIDISTTGTYAVTVYDASGCSGETAVNVTVVDPTQVSILGSDKLCEGGNVTFSAIGGTFTNYEWSTGFNTSSITVDEAGNYAVTVTDNNGCTSSTSINVTVADLPTPEIGGDPNFCIDGNTELNLTESYSSYDWSTGSSDPTISINMTGLYTVTVTDINGCQASNSVNVFTYPDVNPTIGGSATYCPGGNTTLDAGSEYVAWEWSTGEMTQTIQFAMETIISVTVTDINGCTGSSSTGITEEPSLSPSILGDLIICEGESTVLDAGSAFDTWEWSTGEMTQTIEVTDSGIYSVFVTQGTCSGTGEVEVIVNPLPNPEINGAENICIGDLGTLTVAGSYNTYAWSTNSNLESIIVSDPGIYTVTVTDGNGCSNSTSFVVTEVPLPTPEIIGDPNFCPDGNTTLSLSESYTTYEWSNGSQDISVDISMTGQYTVTVTDANGCSGNSAINVFMYPEVNPNIGGSTTYCPGGNTTLDGGPQYIAWEWSTGEITQTIQYAQETIVTLQVTDINGCTGTSAIMVTEEPSLSPAILGDLEICEGETTILDGGAAFDTWIWSTGEMTQTIEVTELGTYTLEVSQGTCSGVGEVTVIVNPIPEPIIDGPESICFGEDATLTSINNFPVYQWTTGDITKSINISNPGSYSLTVTDDNGCTAVNSFTVIAKPTPTLEDIVAICGEDKDTYDVTFSSTADEVSCSTYPVESLGGIDYAVNEIDTNDVIQIYLLDTESMCDTTITIMKPNCACSAIADAGPNGELNCLVFDITLGGSNTSVGPSFTYEWTDESGTVVSTDIEYTATSEGVYTLEVFDADFDCSVSESVTVENIISDPSAQIFPDPGVIIDCEIGIVTLTSANELNVNYTWTTSTFVIEALSINIENGTTIVLLATDTLTFCSNTSSIQIIDNEQYPLIEIADPEELTCETNIVTIDAMNSQNSPDITYTWTNESGSNLGNDVQLDVTSSGWYYLELIDDVNGCQNDDSIYVAENIEAPVVMAGDDILLPCDVTAVSISATVEGNADIIWTTNTGTLSSDVNQEEVNVTSVGVYYFTATIPETGCSAIDSIEVISNEDKISEVDIELRQPECFGDETGNMTITVLAGGMPPFQYDIEEANLSNDNGVFNNLLPGIYEVLITDALNCVFLASFEITDVEEVTFESPTANIELDYGNDTTLVLETNLGFDEIESITWSPDIEGSCNTCLEIDVENVTQGQIYTITLLDIYGCEVTTTIRLDVNIDVDIHVPNIINPNSTSGNRKLFPQTNLENLEVIEFYVYDRWGELVYTAKNFPLNDPIFGWDGTFKGQNVVPGVYVYYMNVAIPGLENQAVAGDITVIY